MKKAPTKADAENAAELLGLDVFDLMHLLRRAAVAEVERCSREVSDYGMLDVGKARRLLAAATACEGAHDDLMAARSA